MTTKGPASEHCFCQYLKNNMADIRLIPLDHFTNKTWFSFCRRDVATEDLGV